MGNKKVLLIIITVILLDQVSKVFLLRFFPQTIYFNQGIAFGFLPSNLWIMINTIILLVILFFLLKMINKNQDIKHLILFLAGGTSNLLDRILRGKVIDFIDLTIFPVFNLADIYIIFGVLALILNLFFKLPKKQPLDIKI